MGIKSVSKEGLIVRVGDVKGILQMRLQVGTLIKDVVVLKFREIGLHYFLVDSLSYEWTHKNEVAFTVNLLTIFY